MNKGPDIRKPTNNDICHDIQEVRVPAVRLGHLVNQERKDPMNHKE